MPKRIVRLLPSFVVLFSMLPGVGFSSAASPQVSSILPPAGRSIAGGGTLQEYRDDHREVAFIPDHPLAEEIRRTLSSQRPNVISERLVVVPRGVSAEEHLELFNSLRRVSSLSGLEYYNPRKGRWHALFNDSWAVDGPDARRRIPDPVVTAIPRDETIFALQDTPPFGELLNEFRYRSDARGAFLFSSINRDSLVYRGMRVARPGQTFSYILVIPGDDYVVTYGIGGVRAFTLFGLLDDRIEGAFGGRTEGLFDWYSREYLEPLR